MFTSTCPSAVLRRLADAAVEASRVNAVVGKVGRERARDRTRARGSRQRASSVFGVPARAAQPALPGPLRYQPPSASGSASAATVVAARSVAVGAVAGDAPEDGGDDTGDARERRRRCIHATRASVPVPRPCTSATGHDAYASQCSARQRRVADAGAKQARDREREQEVERDGAETEPHRAVRRT